MIRPFAPLALLLTAAPAIADEPGRTLRVVNDTSSPVNQLFVSSGRGGLRAKVDGVFGTPEDERDRLDAKMLPRGGSIMVRLKGSRCRYHLRAVLEDGRSFVAESYDICARGQWAISQGARR